MTVAPFFEEHDFQTGDEVQDRLTGVRDLDWQGFLSAYFPGSGRHDLAAITAYAVYKRSRAVDEQSATEAGRLKGAGRTSTEAASVEAWEDEGGAAQ
jgi:hypothetical protein